LWRTTIFDAVWGGRTPTLRFDGLNTTLLMPPTNDHYRFLQPAQAIDALGGVDAARDLLSMVAHTLDTDVPRLTSLMEQDPAQGQALLHTLKGFLPVVCDATLAADVTVVEQMGREGRTSAALAAWPTVQGSLQQLNDEIHHWLKTQDQLAAAVAAPVFVAPAGVVELGHSTPAALESAADPTTPSHLRLEQARAALGDDATVRDMLELLVQTLDTDLPRVTDALDHNDVATAQAVLHPIKGFLPVFCAAELCDLVATVEYLSKNASAAEVRAAFEAVRPQLLELRAEAVAHLASSTDAMVATASAMPRAEAVDSRSPSTTEGLDARELTELPSDFGVSAFGTHHVADSGLGHERAYAQLRIEQAQRLLGGPQAVRDTAVMLAATLRDDLQRIRYSLGEGDTEAVSRMLQGLKESVAPFCDAAMLDTVATVEFLSSQCTAAEVATAFDAVEPSLLELAKELADFVGAPR
jgi:HPt (histidine-containing phosphotransfer) domain-containing protein